MDRNDGRWELAAALILTVAVAAFVLWAAHERYAGCREAGGSREFCLAER